MDFGNARIECTAKNHTGIHSLHKRWRKKQIYQVSEHVEKRTERKKNKDNEIHWMLKKGSTIKEWCMSNTVFI